MYKIFGNKDKGEDKFVKKLFSSIIPEAENLKAYGCVGLSSYELSKNEIDLVLYLSLDHNNPYPPLRVHKIKNEIKEKRYIVETKKQLSIPQNHVVYTETLVFSIEIKSHDASGIIIKGTDIYVKYGDKESCVSSKLISQAETVRSFLNKQLEIPIKIVTPLIYFPNVKKQSFEAISRDKPPLKNGLLFSDSTFYELIHGAILYRGVRASKEETPYSTIGDRNISLYDIKHATAIEKFYKSMTPSCLEQEKLETIGKKFITKNKQWTEEIGKKTIAFIGRAGTGKTLKLLRLCNDLINDYYEPVLFLTFNRALARDVQRLMQLQKISNGTSTTIRTIDQILFQMGKKIDLYEDFDQFKKENDFNNTKAFKFLREYLVEALKDQETLNKIRKEIFRDWNYVAIDEAQDWHQEERDIILKIFNPPNIILSAGADQCMRSDKLANWNNDIHSKEYEIRTIHSNVALRQTSNIAEFCNQLSTEIHIDWSVEPSNDLLGGNIYLFKNYTDEVFDIFLDEVEKNKQKGYEYVDFLVLAHAKNQEIIKILKNRKYSIWDGIFERDRGKIPLVNQIRCASLESCRGLEGWATLVTDIDYWYDYCLNRTRERLKQREEQDFTKIEFIERDKNKEEDYKHLPTWFLIPFTRSKKRLLIQLPKNQKIRNSLLEIQKKLSDFIHIIN